MAKRALPEDSASGGQTGPAPCACRFEGRDGCRLAGGTAHRTLSMRRQTARLVGLDVSRTRRTDLHAGAYGRRGLTASNGRIGFAFRSECGNGNTEARGRFLRHAESGILPADVVGKASVISYNVIYKGRPWMDFPSWRGWLRPAPLFSCAFFRQIAPEGKTVCISILPPGFGVDGCKTAFIIHNYGRRRAMSSEMINENWTRKDVETGRKNSIKTLHPKRGQGVPNEVQEGSKIGHRPV